MTNQNEHDHNSGWRDIVGMCWTCPHCGAQNPGALLNRPRYQCGECGDMIPHEDIATLYYERAPGANTTALDTDHD